MFFFLADWFIYSFKCGWKLENIPLRLQGSKSLPSFCRHRYLRGSPAKSGPVHFVLEKKFPLILCTLKELQKCFSSWQMIHFCFATGAIWLRPIGLHHREIWRPKFAISSGPRHIKTRRNNNNSFDSGYFITFCWKMSKILKLFNNYSSSPNGLWVNKKPAKLVQQTNSGNLHLKKFSLLALINFTLNMKNSCIFVGDAIPLKEPDFTL